VEAHLISEEEAPLSSEAMFLDSVEVPQASHSKQIVFRNRECSGRTHNRQISLKQPEG
jgi:hypothetical protein